MEMLESTYASIYVGLWVFFPLKAEDEEGLKYILLS